jgi:hypothetical protein
MFSQANKEAPMFNIISKLMITFSIFASTFAIAGEMTQPSTVELTTDVESSSPFNMRGKTLYVNTLKYMDKNAGVLSEFAEKFKTNCSLTIITNTPFITLKGTQFTTAGFYNESSWDWGNKSFMRMDLINKDQVEIVSASLSCRKKSRSTFSVKDVKKFTDGVLNF